MIIRENEAPGSILDVGTGSGCIAVSLKAAFPGATITGCDISEKALAVANRNAQHFDLDISFERVDVLHLVRIGLVRRLEKVGPRIGLLRIDIDENGLVAESEALPRRIGLNFKKDLFGGFCCGFHESLFV